MKVKELLGHYTCGYFAINGMNRSELISSTDTLQAINYTYTAEALREILEAEVAEFEIDNYHGHENALVIRISDSNKIFTDSSKQQSTESVEEELSDEAVVLKAALDDFVAAVEGMSTDENSISELAAAMVVLYAIYKNIDRKKG